MRYMVFMELEMGPFELPEQITNLKTPLDQNGDPIADGQWYLVGKRGVKPTRVIVRYDVDQDEYTCQPKGGGFWQRVSEMDPNASWEKVEDDD